MHNSFSLLMAVTLNSANSRTCLGVVDRVDRLSAPSKKVDAEVSHFLTNTCHKVEMVNQTEIEHLLKDSSFRNLFSVNFSPIPAAGGFRKYEQNRKHSLWSILHYLNISYQPFLSNCILVSSNDSDYFPSKIITGEIYDRSISGYCDRTESAYMARITKPPRRGRFKHDLKGFQESVIKVILSVCW